MPSQAHRAGPEKPGGDFFLLMQVSHQTILAGIVGT